MNTETVRVAAVQMDVTLMEVEQNLDAIEQALEEAAGAGARLVVFPECAVTGYCFESLEEALPLGNRSPDPAPTGLVPPVPGWMSMQCLACSSVSRTASITPACLSAPRALSAPTGKSTCPSWGSTVS